MFGGKNGNSSGKNGVPGGVEVKGWTKTQEWINNTKDMSLAEFTKKINESSKCSTKIYDSINELIEACQCNKNNIAHLVHELKRKKMLEGVVKEAFKHEEAYKFLGKMLQNESNARKLDRILSEMVSPPVGSEEEISHPMKDKKFDMSDEMDGENDAENMDDDHLDMDDEDANDMDGEEDDDHLDMDGEEDDDHLDMDGGGRERSRFR